MDDVIDGTALLLLLLLLLIAPYWWSRPADPLFEIDREAEATSSRSRLVEVPIDVVNLTEEDVESLTLVVVGDMGGEEMVERG